MEKISEIKQSFKTTKKEILNLKNYFIDFQECDSWVNECTESKGFGDCIAVILRKTVGADYYPSHLATSIACQKKPIFDPIKNKFNNLEKNALLHFKQLRLPVISKKIFRSISEEQLNKAMEIVSNNVEKDEKASLDTELYNFLKEIDENITLPQVQEVLETPSLMDKVKFDFLVPKEEIDLIIMEGRVDTDIFKEQYLVYVRYVLESLKNKNVIIRNLYVSPPTNNNLYKKNRYIKISNNKEAMKIWYDWGNDTYDFPTFLKLNPNKEIIPQLLSNFNI